MGVTTSQCSSLEGDSLGGGFVLTQLNSSHRQIHHQSYNHLSSLGPEPAFGRLGLGGSSGEYSSHGYTSDASVCAFGAQLGVDRLCQNIFEKIIFKQGQWTII